MNFIEKTIFQKLPIELKLKIYEYDSVYQDNYVNCIDQIKDVVRHYGPYYKYVLKHNKEKNKLNRKKKRRKMRTIDRKKKIAMSSSLPEVRNEPEISPSYYRTYYRTRTRDGVSKIMKYTIRY